MRIIGKIWLPLVFVVSALVLARDPLPFVSPVGEPVAVSEWVTDTTPVRQPALLPRYTAGVYTYSCGECHSIIPPHKEADSIPVRHAEVELKHGLNTRCFNCHHRTNRDAFVDDFGEEIAWDQPQLLCARCHGPVYRDWQAGSHGRTNGHWDTAAGPQLRRKCIECHDPHVPPFQAMKPAPGPRTLRMGPALPPEHGAGHDPLRVTGGHPAKAAHH